MLNHETSPNLIADLNFLILARISSKAELVRIRQDENWETPAGLTLGGRLNGYDPQHSVAVELKGFIDNTLKPIYGIRICNNETCLEEYIISEDEVFNLAQDRVSDDAEIRDLFFWVEQTRWNEFHTQMFADQD
jgi:hypothetical protein